MSPRSDSAHWLQRPQWFFVGGSLMAAVVALIAEGPGQYIGFALLAICVTAISAWSLIGKPSLYWTVGLVGMALLVLGWTVEEPEPALFQSILITAAVGWRVDRLFYSLLLLLFLSLIPLLGTLGPNEPNWGWWNWSVGTVLTWSLGRVIRLLEQTLNELTEARSRLIDSAAREERIRISRDVHDLVGHSLTAMLLNIRAAQRLLEGDHPQAQHALADAERIGTTGIAEIRSVLVDLHRSSTLDSVDYDALSSLPDGEAVLLLLEQQEHIAITSSGDIGALRGPLAIAVYRILQECITNISKHAEAGTGVIKLDVSTSMILLYSQNSVPLGRGVDSTVSVKTLGLISMRERVTSLGGEFSADSDGQLWKLSCRIPYCG